MACFNKISFAPRKTQSDEPYGGRSSFDARINAALVARSRVIPEGDLSIDKWRGNNWAANLIIYAKRAERECKRRQAVAENVDLKFQTYSEKRAEREGKRRQAAEENYDLSGYSFLVYNPAAYARKCAQRVKDYRKRKAEDGV